MFYVGLLVVTAIALILGNWWINRDFKAMENERADRTTDNPRWHLEILDDVEMAERKSKDIQKS